MREIRPENADQWMRLYLHVAALNLVGLYQVGRSSLGEAWNALKGRSEALWQPLAIPCNAMQEPLAFCGRCRV
jgi:hypothetical protein